MKNRLFICLLCIIFSLQTEVFASTRAIGETLEFIFKKAGVVVSKSYKTETEHMLSLAVKKHGDDILEIANKGGINALNCGMKYGDDFWDLCIKYPDSVKILELPMLATLLNHMIPATIAIATTTITIRTFLLFI